MSRKLYCPKCHGSLVKSDVAGLIEELFEQKNGKLVFELEKVREKEKKIQFLYNLIKVKSNENEKKVER